MNRVPPLRGQRSEAQPHLRPRPALLQARVRGVRRLDGGTPAAGRRTGAPPRAGPPASPPVTVLGRNSHTQQLKMSLPGKRKQIGNLAAARLGGSLSFQPQVTQPPLRSAGGLPWLKTPWQSAAAASSLRLTPPPPRPHVLRTRRRCSGVSPGHQPVTVAPPPPRPPPPAERGPSS